MTGRGKKLYLHQSGFVIWRCGFQKWGYGKTTYPFGDVDDRESTELLFSSDKCLLIPHRRGHKTAVMGNS